MSPYIWLWKGYVHKVERGQNQLRLNVLLRTTKLLCNWVMKYLPLCLWFAYNKMTLILSNMTQVLKFYVRDTYRFSLILYQKKYINSYGCYWPKYIVYLKNHNLCWNFLSNRSVIWKRKSKLFPIWSESSKLASSHS